jgi:hypothetical protein
MVNRYADVPIRTNFFGFFPLEFGYAIANRVPFAVAVQAAIFAIAVCLARAFASFIVHAATLIDVECYQINN